MSIQLAGLTILDVKPGGFMESQSGIQRNNPAIFCRFAAPDRPTDTAFVVSHPTSNFSNHYLIDPIVSRHAAILAVNTRYSGNDSMLLMERVIQDLGAGVKFLRAQGYKRVILIGNSGGGAMAAFYQSQAENQIFFDTPDKRPIDLGPDDLPRADGIVLTAAHPGRAGQLLTKIDGSVTDENQPEAINAELDMFNSDNGPAYSTEFVQRYRTAQQDRLERITTWVENRLAELEQQRDHNVADEAFVIHKTQADPRLLDLSLDANDRQRGSIQGAARMANQSSNGLARFCTLRSFLSQWSPRHTRAEGPTRLAETQCPVLLVEHTADQTVFPSHIARWRAACSGRETFHALKGAGHYLDKTPGLIDETADLMLDWASGL